MKRQLMCFVLGIVTIMMLSGTTFAEENEIEFVYNNSYDATVEKDLVIRNEYGERIAVVPEGEHVVVEGFFPNDSERVQIYWNGIEGSVLKDYVERDKLYSITQSTLEQTDNFGNCIQIIPEGEIVVMDEEDTGPVQLVKWDGIQGFVQSEGLIGDFIFINIQEQIISMYKDHKMICQSPIVTGLDGTERQTPTGIFSIQNMSRCTILKGEYYEAYVEYWMPFYYGYGIHDADGWRNSYGGDIYKYDGSHGCVNVPLTTAQTIYENTYVGMLVIIK